MTNETDVASKGSFLDVITKAVRQGHEYAAVRALLARGIQGESELTNHIFFARHPELGRRRLRADEIRLIEEWRAVRDEVVRPILQSLPAGPAGPATGPVPRTAAKPRVRTTSWLREAWSAYRCAERRMTWMRIFGTNTPVNPLTTDAFRRLESVLRSAGYVAAKAWNYNCREIKGHPGRMSLHSYGLAVDLDPACNPHRKGVAHAARFSSSPTQAGRCADVRARRADTALTPDQVAAVEAIRTVDGLQVFAWGGRWRGSPDAMHFQINVGPAELQRGLAGS